MAKHHYGYTAMVMIVIATCMLGIMLMRDFTGWAGYEFNLTSGNIYYVQIDVSPSASTWTGFAGYALHVISNEQNEWNHTVSAGNVTSANFYFNCMGKTGYDFYASTWTPSQIDINTIQAATPADIDAYVGNTGDEIYSANLTFSDNVTVNFGGGLISAPALYTKQYSGSEDFPMFALKDGNGKLVFGGWANKTSVGYDGSNYNYQFMLPMPANTSFLKYYFFPDPVSDPLGNCSEMEYGWLRGVVTDARDSHYSDGTFLSNVSLNISGGMYYTDENGYYNIFLQVKEHLIKAKKPGFQDFYGSSSVQVMQPTWYNFSMVPDMGAAMVNATLKGYVFDNSSGAPLANATVAGSGGSTLSTSSGYYQLAVGAGNITWIAVKYGFNAEIGSLFIDTYEEKWLNITLQPSFSGEVIAKAFLKGHVKDNSTGLPLGNVTVAAAGYSGNTNQSGNYQIPVSDGNTTVFFSKSGYEAYMENVYIPIYDTVELNASLNPALSFGGQNSILAGWITDYYTQQPIVNVTVSSGTGSAKTNGSGYYEFAVSAGNNTVIGIKQGYNPYIGSTTNYPWQTNYHNFTLARGIEDYPNATLTGSTFLGTTLLSNVTIAIGGFITQSDDNGSYSISLPAKSFYYLFAMKADYEIFMTNLIGNNSLTPGNTTYYNITMEKYSPPGLGPGMGPGAGPGSGPGLGPGLGPGSGVMVERPEEISEITTDAQKIKDVSETVADVVLSLDRIIRKIRQGSFLEDFLVVYNYRPTSVDLQARVEGDAAKLIDVKTPTVKVPPNSSMSIRFRILGNAKQGIYNGNMVIDGDYRAVIPIEVSIIKEEDLPIEAMIMNIKPLNKVVNTNGLLRYKLDLVNLLIDRAYNINIHYSINHQNGTEIIPIGDEELSLQTFHSVINEYRIPDDFPVGDYILTADATYMGKTATSSALFTVKLPVYKYRIFGFLPVWLLFVLLFVAGATLITIKIVKKQMEKKKRFHAKIDYKLLPQPGERSLFVGQIAETTHDSYMDMDVLTVHTIVA
ncbi:MAG: carboxypeptidase regulatory-like domain-containing protein, partial [Nanoarchaeota archaeon]|nr:carboxypeptidase regulatory-like domain-containing protein [Nanoarchaeota archaeon]